MKAVLMAGGKGTRLTGLTKDLIPKPMVPLMGKPLLQWQIEQLSRNGINDFILVIGHLGQCIFDYFGDGSAFHVSIQYFQEKKPLGTAGALPEVLHLLGDETFFLAFGDILFDIDIKRMEEFHRKHQAAITLFTHPNDHPADSDVVVVNSQNRIVNILKKNEARETWYNNCVNAGLYLVQPHVVRRIIPGIKTDFEKDVILPIVHEEGAIYGYASPEYVKDIGTTERVIEAENALRLGLVHKKNLLNKQKAVFLDRDGTINMYNGLIYHEDQLKLEKKAAKAIRILNHLGWLVILITNQPCVARGLCTTQDVDRIHRKLQTLLGQQGAYLDGIYYCPHHPDKGYPEENPLYKIPCHCRKPDTGLLAQCEEQFHISLADSWFVGDTTVDIQTGKNAGTHTALVHTGLGGDDKKYDVVADIEGKDLLDIVYQITHESC